MDSFKLFYQSTVCDAMDVHLKKLDDDDDAAAGGAVAVINTDTESSVFTGSVSEPSDIADMQEFGKTDLFYKTKMCASIIKGGSCNYADRCVFAHSEEELRPHPLKTMSGSQVAEYMLKNTLRDLTLLGVVGENKDFSAEKAHSALLPAFAQLLG